MITHGSFFTGIGGFDLAAEKAGYKNIFSCEIDEFCNKVLEKNFPHVQRYTDIRDFDGRPYRGKINIVSGGFPCQPYSIAGKRRGTEDNRDLWPEYFRVIKEIGPDWAVGENVANFANMELERSLSDLESEGYEVQPLIIPALALGAIHRRDRVWIIAHSRRKLHEGSEKQDKGGRETKSRDAGFPERPISALESLRAIADSNGQRLERLVVKYGREGAELCDKFPLRCDREGEEHWFEAATRLCGVDDGAPVRLDGFKLTKAQHRERRLKALGNGIYWPIAYEIFSAIKQIDNKQNYELN